MVHRNELKSDHYLAVMSEVKNVFKINDLPYCVGSSKTEKSTFKMQFFLVKNSENGRRGSDFPLLSNVVE